MDIGRNRPIEAKEADTTQAIHIYFACHATTWSSYEDVELLRKGDDIAPGKNTITARMSVRTGEGILLRVLDHYPHFDLRETISMLPSVISHLS